MEHITTQELINLIDRLNKATSPVGQWITSHHAISLYAGDEEADRVFRELDERGESWIGDIKITNLLLENRQTCCMLEVPPVAEEQVLTRWQQVVEWLRNLIRR